MLSTRLAHSFFNLYFPCTNMLQISLYFDIDTVQVFNICCNLSIPMTVFLNYDVMSNLECIYIGHLPKKMLTVPEGGVNEK